MVCRGIELVKRTKLNTLSIKGFRSTFSGFIVFQGSVIKASTRSFRG